VATSRDHQTLYADVGGAQLAYQIVGLGADAPALIQAHSLYGNVELRWEDPDRAASTERLATFGRVIDFDSRGQGISDPLPPDAGAIWENWAEDQRAVLDAAGCDRAAILATGMLGPSAILFAATYPAYVSALFLVNTSSRLLVDDDYPIGYTQEVIDLIVEALSEEWGTEQSIERFVPSKVGDQGFLERGARHQRAAATPKTAHRQISAIFNGDIRDALPAIQAPTVVFHRRSGVGGFLTAPMADYLAEHIPAARLVLLDGEDIHLVPGRDDAAYDEIERVLTGELKARESERVFATVIVEDIVGSTDRAAQLGDERWKQVLNQHDDIAARTITPGGRIVDTTGDGVVAVFESPSRALRCIQLMRDEMRSLDLEIRVGVHAGEIERRGTDIAGIGVHIAARVCAEASPGELLASRTVVDLVVGSNARFSDKGEHPLKGVPGSWRLFSVVG